MQFSSVYSTCLFCHADLGRNEVLEHFPVGRRLAYDAAKGRLWVVCGRCDRWNLTPQEERWEAMEEAERMFRGTRLRTSTEHIGLAQVADGTELVRIGAPLRPEFAAWRYGDQFGRRRSKRLALAGGLATAVAVPLIAGPEVAAATAVAAVPLTYVGAALAAWYKRRAGQWVAIPGQAPLLVGHDWARSSRFLAAREAGAVRLELRGRQLHPKRGLFGRASERDAYAAFELTGSDAIRAASQILSFVNGSGGSRRAVTAALTLLDGPRSDDGAFAQLAADARRPEHRLRWLATTPGALGDLRPSIRLALEMAAHEDQERRAMVEGELAELERAWRDAEEIAAIADDLLLPASVDARLDQLRGPGGRSTARAGDASSPPSDSGSASNS